MAGIAFHSRNKVAWVLADCGGPVVTGRTGAKHLRVVNVKHRRPNGGRVAVFTNVRRKRMRWVFAGSDSAVVTAYAVTRYVRMVKSCRYPGDSCMAVITIIAARYVRRMLAGRSNAVMAGAAAT